MAPTDRWQKCTSQKPQPPTLQLTHLPVLHKEDVQRVQGAEVEDVNVVFHRDLGRKDMGTSTPPPTYSRQAVPKASIPSHPIPPLSQVSLQQASEARDWQPPEGAGEASIHAPHAGALSGVPLSPVYRGNRGAAGAAPPYPSLPAPSQELQPCPHRLPPRRHTTSSCSAKARLCCCQRGSSSAEEAVCVELDVKLESD